MLEQSKTPKEIGELDADGVRCELLLDALSENCTTHHNACTCREAMRKALVVAFDEYIGILGEEIGSLATLGSLHGRSSKRVAAGAEARDRIKQLRERLGV